ncbi:MAG: protein TolR [Pseudomonadota bacterium]
MGRRSRGRRLLGEINVVPYIDVMLVLLVIFMVTAPLLTQGIEVDLPQAGAEPLDSEDFDNQEPLVLSIDRDGLIYLNVGENEDAAIDESTALFRATAVLRRSPQTPVLVRADQAVPYGNVVRGMVLLQQAGAAKIGFVTDAPQTPLADPDAGT